MATSANMEVSRLVHTVKDLNRDCLVGRTIFTMRAADARMAAPAVPAWVNFIIEALTVLEAEPDAGAKMIVPTRPDSDVLVGSHKNSHDAVVLSSQEEVLQFFDEARPALGALATFDPVPPTPKHSLTSMRPMYEPMLLTAKLARGPTSAALVPVNHPTERSEAAATRAFTSRTRAAQTGFVSSGAGGEDGGDDEQPRKKRAFLVRCHTTTTG